MTELGIWQGHYQNVELPWLRWWDATGRLLPTVEERAEQADARAQATDARAAQANEQAQKLAAKLRELGIDPEQVT